MAPFYPVFASGVRVCVYQYHFCFAPSPVFWCRCCPSVIRCSMHSAHHGCERHRRVHAQCVLWMAGLPSSLGNLCLPAVRPGKMQATAFLAFSATLCAPYIHVQASTPTSMKLPHHCARGGPQNIAYDPHINKAPSMAFIDVGIVAHAAPPPPPPGPAWRCGLLETWGGGWSPVHLVERRRFRARAGQILLPSHITGSHLCPCNAPDRRSVTAQGPGLSAGGSTGCPSHTSPSL